MSGTNTEWGDQAQVTSVQLTATNPDGTPVVMMPALQGPSQQPVVVPGPALVEAAAALVPPGSTWHVVTAVPDASFGAVGDFAYLSTTGDIYQKQNQTTAGVTTAVWVVVGNIQGAAGSNGSVVYSITGTPSAGLGANGDQSIDPSNGNIWLKLSGTWSLEGSIKGPTGASPVFSQGITTTVPAGTPAQLLVDNTNPLNPVINAQIPQGATGPAVAQGPWTQVLAYNVATNLPALTANGGGYPSTTLLVVTTAGTMTVDNVGALNVGDFLVGGGTKWTKLTGGVAIQAATSFLITGLLTLASGGGFGFTDGAYGFSGIYVGADGEFIAGHKPNGAAQIGGFLLVPNTNGSGTLYSADGLNTPILSYLNGVVTVYGTPVIPGTTFSTSSATPSTAWAAIGPDGEYLPLLDFAGNFQATAQNSTSLVDFSAERIAAFDAMVLARAALQNERARALTQPIMNGAINAFIWYGQSLSTGTAGNPALSTTPLSPGVVTVGTRLILTSSQAVLTPTMDGNFHEMYANPAANEIPLVAAMFGLKFLDCSAQGLPVSDTTRTFVSNSAGVGGKTIELLSYGGPIEAGNVQNYFTGLDNMVAAQAAAATAAGKDFYIPVFFYHQGEANYGTAGVVHDAPGYSAAVIQLQTDFFNQIVKKYCPKQTLPPLVILAQTGGIFVKDGQSLGVSTGQMLAAATSPTIVCIDGCGNLQSRPDQAGHPSVNSYRQLGNKIAQVIEQVVIKRQSWEYMCLKSDLTWWKGSTVLVGLMPRKAPIRLALPFNGYSAVTTQPATLGFSAVDSVTGSPISVVGASIVGAATLQLTIGGTPANPPLVSDSDQANYAGNTFIEDSDNQEPPAIGYNTYQYVTGMETGENIPALIGTEYSMRNQMLLGQVLATAK